MRLRNVKLHNLTTYRDPVEVEFPDGIVAIQGTNGSGKTTLLEAPFAALHKSFATRPGSLYDYATGDAYIEAEFQDDGDTVTVRLTIDADRRTTEGYVLVNGQAVTDGKAQTFQEAIAERFGSARLMLASVFAAQDKSGSITGLRKGDRKSLFVELLGLGYIEALAARARDEAAAAVTALERGRATKEAAEQELASVPKIDLEQAECRLAEVEGFLDAARRTEEQQREALTATMASAERTRGLQRRLDELERLGQQHAEARRRAVKRRKDAVESFQATKQRIDMRRESLQKRLDEMPDAEVAKAALDEAEVKRTAAAKMIEELRAMRQDADKANTEIERCERERKRIEADRQRRYEDAKRRAELLDRVPCTKTVRWIDDNEMTGEEEPVPDVDLAGTCPLLADAQAAKRDLGASLIERTEEDERISEERNNATKWRDQLVLKINTFPGERILQERLDEAQQECDAARQMIAATGTRKDIEAALLACETDMRDAEQRCNREAGQAESDEREADRRAGECITEMTSVREELRGVSGVDVGAAQTALREAVKTREALERESRDAAVLVDRARQAAEQLAGARQKLDRITAEIAPAEQGVTDWQLLAQSLGKDGVQALEIDAAAPEVTEVANELLSVYPGRQFSVRIDTLRLKRDGDYAEDFRISVYEGADERSIEALSGGERVVVGEALSLALAILNARKNRVRWETLWRDETAGALDPEAAQAYVAMLRRARDLGGFAQVVFVAHQQEVWEQADVVVHVEAGRIVEQEVAA